MGQKISAMLGFTIGLGAACLLNPAAYSRISSQAIALPLAQSVANHLTFSATVPVAQGFTPVASSCSSNSDLQGQQLRSQRPGNTSLLKHVPSPPQRLSWYGITQRGAIANAPRANAPKPAITHWHTAPFEKVQAVANCPGQSVAIDPTSDPSSASFLQQQSHFILSLGSLTQKNDWLLQPNPEPDQAVHAMWQSELAHSSLDIASTTID